MRTIDVHQLKADLEAGIVPVLIDVRTPAEYASGHVDAAITVPLQTIPGKIAELEAYKGNTVYMICKLHTLETVSFRHSHTDIIVIVNTRNIKLVVLGMSAYPLRRPCTNVSMAINLLWRSST